MKACPKYINIKLLNELVAHVTDDDGWRASNNGEIGLAVAAVPFGDELPAAARLMP